MCCLCCASTPSLLAKAYQPAGKSLFVAFAAPCCRPLVAAGIPIEKAKKRQQSIDFFAIFSALFLNIWPLAGPNIEKRVGSLQALARVDRQTHFGTFNFWIKPGFPI